MNRTLVNVLLVVLLLSTAYRVVDIAWTPGPLDRMGALRGCDFQVFYLGAWMIDHGETDQLYREGRLQELQSTLGPINNERNPPYFLYYPPIAPLLLVPLARLAYTQATNIWWLLQGICFCISGWLLARSMQIASGWRTTAWLALLAFYPVWDTVLHGQLSAELLLILVAGFELQRRRHPVAAAWVLSLLAMKPQWFAGVYLWLLLRRDWRSLAAMTAGLACQLAAVAAILGTSVLVAYVEFLPTCGRIALRYAFSPWAEHGIAGIVQNVLVPFGCPKEWGHRVGTLVQLLVAAWAGLMLYRGAAAGRLARIANATRNGGNRDSDFSPTAQERTCGVLFTALLTPHLLMYDLVLLAAPLVNLWSSPRWRLGVALYLATCVITIPLYETIGFSLVPIVAATVLYRLTQVNGDAGVPAAGDG